MKSKETDRLEYLIALISEFAEAHSISTAEAFKYLDEYKGLDFVEKFYEVEHTLSFDDVVDDLTQYCHRHGGRLV